MIARKAYLERLMSYEGKRLIKIITGVRRCGKSTLLEMMREALLARGVDVARIQAINLEDLRYEGLRDYRALHEHILSRLVPGGMNYVFLDEIQMAPDFQRAVDSLFLREDVDLYLTGSNAYMLSGDLATLLSGRYVQLHMLPLSFAEYVSTYPDRGDLPRKYREYLQGSAFPYARQLTDEAQVQAYLEGLYSTVLLKDVVARRSIADVSVLQSLVRFLFDNVGSLVSARKIADTMTSTGRKITAPTVESYLSALVDAYILYPAGRYDIKGRGHLKTLEKYYAIDLGLRRYILGDAPGDTGHVLENVVYLELVRRGYRVYVGKIDAAEVDFVCERGGRTLYVQVSATVRAEETMRRELASLDAIADHNPKLLLTLDDDPPAFYNGIQQRYVLDWLLGEG